MKASKMKQLFFIHSNARDKEKETQLVKLLHANLPMHIDLKRGRIENYLNTSIIIEICDDPRSKNYNKDIKILERKFPKTLLSISNGPYLIARETYVKILNEEEKDIQKHRRIDEDRMQMLIASKICDGEIYIGQNDIINLIKRLEKNDWPSSLYADS